MEKSSTKEVVGRIIKQGKVEQICEVDGGMSRITLTSFEPGEFFVSFLFPGSFERDHGGQTAVLIEQNVYDPLTGRNSREYLLDIGTGLQKRIYLMSAPTENIQKEIEKSYEEDPEACRFLTIVS